MTAVPPRLRSFLQSKAALVVLLVLASFLFLERASVNGRVVNTDVRKTDQGAYINYAIKLKESGYTEVGSRNRMPMYPLLLSVFVQPGETQHTFFERGKTINLLLSLAGLALVGAVFLHCFPRHHALNLLFLTAFTVFLFKAPHVQAEILYYLLTFGAFLLCWRLFKKPSFILAGLAGVIMGLTHLTKASVLPGLFCFVVYYGLDALWKNRPPLAARAWRWLLPAVSVLLFLAVIFPYIRKSKEIYGHYFYNVNSTFYFWCDSWEEAKARTKEAGDRQGWPDLKPEETPSAANYFRTHSPGQILERIGKGLSRVNSSMRKSYGYYGIGLTYSLFALGLIVWRRKLCLRLFLRRPMPVLAVLSYFGGYFLLVAWYSQIISGNRFILGLFLPWIFTLAAVSIPLARRLHVPVAGKKLPLLIVFNTAISLWLFIEIAVIFLLRVPTTYGGG